MGRIVWKRGVLLDTLVDIAGFKAGLILTHDEVREAIPEHKDNLIGAADGLVGMRSEEYEYLAQEFLYAIGAAKSNRPAMITQMDFHAKYFPDQEKLQLHYAVSDLFFKVWSREKLKSMEGSVDVTSFLPEAKAKFGLEGLRMALEILDHAQTAANESPWNRINRHEDWKDTKELQGLFKSAKLDTAYGKFFDQRFINYLHQNFECIDRVHWRKFEALTGEHFAKEGAHVVLGPGSNDDGVDLRVWWTAEGDKPAAIIVQCKRQKDKVAKVVLKSVYADILAENAASGLIVTTQGLEPGAEAVRVARSYPIEVADRTTLREWVTKMRSGYLKA